MANGSVEQNTAFNDNGTSTLTVFDTGTEPWTSETSAYHAYQRLQSQRVVLDSGGQQVKQYDPNNTHPYTELDIDEDASGKIIAAKPKIDGQPAGNDVDFSAVGQVLGSALGRALAPNNQFVQLAAGTVVGAVGQKLAQAFVASLATDGAGVKLDSVFSDFNVSIAGAGASSVASFLVAELGTALHLDGFGGQLFNAAGGGFAGSVASQIATSMARDGVSFTAAVGTLNFANAAASAAYGVSSLLGSYLGHELVPAQTHEGAVGGQLLGAIGSAIGISAAIGQLLGSVLDFLLPGVGSLIGTVLGTLIGDAFGSHPHPAAVDLLDQAGDHYGYSHSSSSDGGGYDIADQMAAATAGIVNGYLTAVKGVVIDHSKQTMVGYVSDPDFRYVDGWTPNHHYYSFISADDAVHAAALDILQHTEVIGGDLLLKRAHQNSASNIAGPEPEWAGLTTPSSQSGAEQFVTMSADLAVAQDYENYLNNREAINALIAANPNSAFAAGWIATFARVNDLGLNHGGASDFLGGLVGYLDSVNKAGLGGAANASVSHGGVNDSVITVAIKAPNGAEVPGSLSAFADLTTVSSDASGQTVQLQFGANLAVGFQRLGAGAVGGNAANDLWFGGDGGQTFNGAAGHDILVGGAGNDVIHGGAGWDFVDGGAGIDYLFGDDGNDILHGGRDADFLYGGAGNDTYAFNRGDGADTVYDDYRTLVFVPNSGGGGGGIGGGIGGGLGGGTYVPAAADGGQDTLSFGAGIGLADITVALSGNDLIVSVKDPAHPGVPSTDQIKLQDWNLAFNRIEKFAFADGATLDLSGGVLAPFQVPFGETLSGAAVAEHSAVGTVVGTVSGFDFNPTAALSYSLLDSAGGRFAVNASTGVLTVAGAINYDDAHALQVVARVSDGAHVFDKAFSIGVIDMPNHAPVLTVPASSIKAAPGSALQVSSWFSAFDADNDALTYCFADGTAAASSGQFVLNGTPLGQGAVFSVNAAQLAGLTFVAGAADSPDSLSMQLTDGHAVSANLALSIHANHAPVLTGPANLSVSAGQSLQVASLFGATDADGDTLLYFFQDGTTDANSGHFVLNGTAIAQGAGFYVTGAAQLAQLSFVAGSVDDNLSMQLADSSGALSAGAGFQVHVNHGMASDFDGNRHDDILWRRDDGTVAVWDNGQISQAHWVADPGTAGSDWTVAGKGDFDGNGHDDILWIRDNGRASVWDNGQLAAAHGTADPGTVSNGWHIVGVGDFDGNGHDDILGVRDDGTVTVWDNGQVAAAHWIAGPGTASNGWHFSAIGDFDGNGHDDILWVRDDGTASIWDNGQVASAHWIAGPGTVSNGWHVAGAGDFDGNGHDDILGVRDDGTVTVWDNGQVAAAHWIAGPGTVASDWKFAGVGDFDGNGHDDILWRRDNGTVAVWDNGALAAAHWIADPSQIASGWHIA